MNFPDQFQNMRLEINEMSHEEGMFECLSEQVYCSIDRIHEEASYPICLEGYKNGEKVGKMKKCGPYLLVVPKTNGVAQVTFRA
ncbi:hypothetical protein Tco_1488330 [Tanacetum coccineum]